MTMRKILVVAALVLCGGCTDEHDAIRTLVEEGYAQAEITPPSALIGCGSGERAFGFRAVRDSRSMRGNVCCGLTGNCIVRGEIDQNAEVRAKIDAVNAETERRRQMLSEEGK